MEFLGPGPSHVCIDEAKASTFDVFGSEVRTSLSQLCHPSASRRAWLEEATDPDGG